MSFQLHFAVYITGFYYQLLLYSQAKTIFKNKTGTTNLKTEGINDLMSTSKMKDCCAEEDEITRIAIVGAKGCGKSGNYLMNAGIF